MRLAVQTNLAQHLHRLFVSRLAGGCAATSKMNRQPNVFDHGECAKWSYYLMRARDSHLHQSRRMSTGNINAAQTHFAR